MDSRNQTEHYSHRWCPAVTYRSKIHKNTDNWQNCKHCQLLFCSADNIHSALWRRIQKCNCDYYYRI